MKYLLVTVGLAGVVLSCNDDNEPSELPAGMIDEEFVVSILSQDEPDLASVRREGVTVTETPVINIEDGREIGKSFLVRHRHGLLTVFKSDDLPTDHAITMWWVMFNRPENCETDCGLGDLSTADVEADVLYADGQVISASGSAVFVAHIREDDLSGSVAKFLWDGPAIGLKDVHAAEIHMVLRTHGPVIPDLAYEMTHTFNGGCGGFPPEAGAPGPNVCMDIQFAVHQAM
ncbi:MAG: hypothetical protein AAGA85_09820 [Bacteroidota bacterium]